MIHHNTRSIGKTPVLLNKVKFRRPVIPGDQLVFELKMVKQRGPVCVMKGVGRVDGKVVAEAELKAQVVDR